MAETVLIHEVRRFKGESTCEIPLFLSPIRAGFPSPAEDYIEGTIDFNRLLVQNENATYTLRVHGDSMTGAGIHSGDLIIVDRSLVPTDKKVVVASVNGELTVKRLNMLYGRPYLVPANDKYSSLEVKDADEFTIFGVVTSVIHKV